MLHPSFILHQQEPQHILPLPTPFCPCFIPFSLALSPASVPHCQPFSLMAAAAAEEVPEPLKYQTLALKVSIHCEGCKREVKRVLQHIEGVYKISIDSQQHKVVVTGNVAAETLIKKLTKTGKHAELWPQAKPNENTAGGGSGKKKKSKNKNDGKPNEPSEHPENNQTSLEDDGSAEVSDTPDGEAPKNDKNESTPVPEKSNGAEKSAAIAGSGKKKGKKGQKQHNNNNSGGNGGPYGTEVEVASLEDGKKAAGGGGGLVIPSAHYFPMYNEASELPSYVLSYSSVQPSLSYSGPYYQMPIHQSSYIYSTASPGSYYIFSEENANACRIM